MINSLSIKRPAGLEYVHECLGLLLDYAGSHGFAGPDLLNLRLIAEEVLANIIAHAYDEDRGDIEITCRPKDPPGCSLCIEFRDSGVPFAFDAPEPELSTDISERPVGGLGIYIVKSLASDVRYRRGDGENILTVTVRQTNLNEE